MKLRNACKIGLMSLLLSPLPAKAQDYVVDGAAISPERSGSVSLPASTGLVPGGYFWGRGDFGTRPGVKGNYYSSGLFAPIAMPGDESMWFLDAELWLNQNGNLGGDGGFGYRHMIGNWSSIGVNNFFTYDRSLTDNDYKRYSVGAEWFTNYLGVTANAYIPLNNHAAAIGPPTGAANPFFQTNYLYFQLLQRGEQQLGGGDVEVGTPVPGMEWLSVYAGAYHFDSKQSTGFTGVSGRALVDLTSALVDVTVQNDKVFGTTVNVGTEFRIGAGPFVFTPRYRNLQTQIYDRVRKRDRILVNQVQTTTLEQAINPATGNPYYFTHVDNTAAPGGTGTYESRFNNLGLASGSPADIILVHRGSTNFGNPLPAGTGLVLSDNQLVLGEGVPFLLQTANVPAPIPLPDWDQTGASPFVSADPGSNVITLANNNTVNGLNIFAPAGGHMIAGTGIDGFTLRNLNMDFGPGQFTGTGGGVYLLNASGTGLIDNFNYRVANTTASGGIEIINVNAPDLGLTVRNSAFIQGGKFGVALVANNSTINSTINNVHTTGNGTGLWLQSMNGGSLSATGSNNSFVNAVLAPGTSGDNIFVHGNTGSSITMNLTNTVATGAGVDGMNVNTLGGSVFNGTLTNAQFGNAGDNAFSMVAAGGSTSTLVGVGVSGPNAGGNAIQLDTDASTMTVNMTSVGSFANAGGDAVHFTAENGGVLNLTIADPASFDGANGSGVFGVVQDSSANLSLLDLTFNNALGDGFYLLASNSTVTANLNLVAFDSVGGNALSVNATTGSQVSVTGNRVSGDNAGGDGINVVVDSSSVALNLANTGSFASAGGDGVQFFATNGASLTLGISGPAGGTSFDSPGGSGVIGAAVDSNIALNLQNVSFDNALRGLDIATNNSTFDATLNNVSLDNAGAEAIRIQADNLSTVLVNADTISGASAGGNAIRLGADNSFMTVAMTNLGSFAGFGGNGVDFSAVNNSSLHIDLAGPGTFDNAPGYGVRGDATDSFVTLGLNSLSFDSATLDGIQISADNSIVNATLNNTSFDNAGMNALNFMGVNGSSINISGDSVSGASAGADAMHLVSDSSSISLSITNLGSFADSGNDGISFLGTNGANFTVTLTGTGGEFDDTVATGYGVHGDLTDSAATLQLQGLSFNNASQDGFFVTGNSSALTATLTDVGFNSAGGNALNLVATNGSSFNVSGSSVTGAGAGADAVLLNANASILGLTLTGGDFAGFANNGIEFSAANGSSLDLIVIGTTGLNNASGYGMTGNVTNSVSTLLLQDVSFAGATQDAVRLSANNGTINAPLFNNIKLDNAGGNALNLTATNGSIVNLAGDGVSGAGAGGDALHLVDDASTMNITLTNVGDFSNYAGDGIDFTVTNGASFGLGISGSGGQFDTAVASGNGVIGNVVNSTANLALQDLTFNKVSLAGFQVSTNNSTFNATLTNVGFNDAGANALTLLASNGSAVTLNASGIGGARSGGDAVHLIANSSTMSVTLQNIDSFADSAGDGIDFVANNSASFVLNVIGPADFSDLPGTGGNGVIGSITNSTASLAISDANFNNAALQGYSVSVNNSTLDENLINVTFDNAGGSGFTNAVTNNSTVNATLANVSLNNAGGSGFTMTANGNSTITAAATNLSMDDAAGGHALKLGAVGGSAVTFTGNGITGARAGGDAINLVDNGSTMAVTLLNVGSFADSAGDGIEFSAVNSTNFSLNITGPADFSDPAGGLGGRGVIGYVDNSTASLSLNNANFNNATQEGFVVSAVNSTFDASLTNVTFDNAGGAGFKVTMDNTVSNGPGISLANVSANNASGGPAFSFIASNGSNVLVSGDTLSGANAGGSGIVIVSANGVMNVGLTNLGSFANAAGNGMFVDVTGGSYPDFLLNASAGAGAGNFSGAGLDGLSINLHEYNGFNAGNEFFTIDGLNFSGATQNGLAINSQGSAVNGATFNGLITNTSFANTVNGDAVFVNVNWNNTPQSVLTFQNVDLTNPGLISLEIISNNNSVFTINLNGADTSGGTSVSGDGTGTTTINP